MILLILVICIVLVIIGVHQNADIRSESHAKKNDQVIHVDGDGNWHF